MTRTLTLHAQWIETLNSQRSLPFTASVALWVAATVVKWRQRRRTRIHLCQLDAHLLRDVGLTERDAHYEANRHFWQA